MLLPPLSQIPLPPPTPTTTGHHQAAPPQPPTDRFDAAEKVILRWDSNSVDSSRRSLNWEDSHEEADEYLLAVDEILNLMDELSVWSDTLRTS
jgi:hypothetical protein